MNRNEELIGRIIFAMPKRERVAPAEATHHEIAAVFARKGQTTSSARAAVATILELMKGTSEHAMLPITASNLGRLVDRMLEQDPIALPPMYKAVSFNPSSAGGREWMYLLDFFSLMRRFNDDDIICTGTFPFTVVDASAYWVINTMGDRFTVDGRDSEEAARSLVASINEWCASPQDNGIQEARISRHAYLRAIAQEFPVLPIPKVFAVEGIWREESFIPFLARAIELFCKCQADNSWKVVKAVSYRRYIQYSEWVTPLVTAEHAFLSSRGYRATLAPTQEAVWSAVVEQACIASGAEPFVVFNYVRPPASAVPYPGVPLFCDDAAEIERKISQSAEQGLPQFAALLVEPFCGKPLAHLARECQYRTLAGEIAEVAARIYSRAVQFAGDGIPAIDCTKMKVN